MKKLFMVAFVASAVLFAAVGCASSTPSTVAPTTPVPGSTASQETLTILADYPGYISLEEIVSKADVIIAGTWLESHYDMLYPRIIGKDDPSYNDPIRNPHFGVELPENYMERAGVPITVSSIKINSVFKGSLIPGATISVHQNGGLQDGILYVEGDTTLLQDVKSPEILLFLADWGDGKYDPINPEVGAWQLSGVEVSPISENAKTSFTIDNVSEVRAEVSRQIKGKVNK